MDKSFGLIAVNPVLETVLRAHSTTKWLMSLSIIFGTMWLLHDADYILFGWAIPVSVLSVLCLTLQVGLNERRKTLLKTFGLSNIVSIGPRVYLAEYNDRFVEVELVDVTPTRVNVRIRSLPKE